MWISTDVHERVSAFRTGKADEEEVSVGGPSTLHTHFGRCVPSLQPTTAPFCLSAWSHTDLLLQLSSSVQTCLAGKHQQQADHQHDDISLHNHFKCKWKIKTNHFKDNMLKWICPQFKCAFSCNLYSLGIRQDDESWMKRCCFPIIPRIHARLNTAHCILAFMCDSFIDLFFFSHLTIQENWPPHGIFSHSRQQTQSECHSNSTCYWLGASLCKKKNVPWCFQSLEALNSLFSL